MRVIFMCLLMAFAIPIAAQNLIITTDINNAGGDPDDFIGLLCTGNHSEQKRIFAMK